LCSAQVGELGATKVRQPLWKTLVLSMLAGCYTSFGATLALTVGCNCPGLAATNPGLQRAVMGLYGLPIGAMM
jgi:formate/nitrite transporter FocA (FNT family)